MKKKIIGIISGIGISAMIMTLVCFTDTKGECINDQGLDNTEQGCCLALETDSLNEEDYMVIATNALEMSKDEQEEVIEKMIEDIPEKQIEELEDMSISELKDDLNNLDEQYEVGEPFSEEDQNKLLYAYATYGPGAMAQENDNEIVPVGWVWRSYDIGNTKTKYGVKIGYSGTLKTYSPAEGGTYATDVDVKVYSGKSNLVSAKWKTRHTAYGVLGTSGQSVNLGIVYDGSVSSSKYAKSFGFEKKKTYSGIWAVYLKTWGILDVKTDTGEFNMQTTTKTSWE